MYLQDAELYRLRSARDAAKQRQQTAWQTQQSAYERRSSANAIMNQAYEAQQTAYTNQQAAWDAYMSVKQANGPRIDSLNSQQERAYHNMVSAFESASSAYYARNGASARMYADQGHAYKAESQACVTERRQLVAKIRTAREQFEAVRPAFQRAKSEYTQARQEFLSAKAEHERAQAEFKKAKAEFDACAKAFKDRLDELKSAHRKRRKEKKSIAEKAGVPLQYQDNVLISTDPDGITNIYFGGIGKPNGTGHGHYAMDRNGNVTYRREPFDPHGTQNFTDAPGGILYDRRARTDVDVPGGTLYDRRARTNTLPLGVRNRDNDTNDRNGVFYDRRRQIDLHVTQYYKDNCRVSWDTKGKSDENYHWTDQNFPSSHPESHIPPEDAQ
jgi:hypothetical protein cdivTM_02561